MIGFGDCERIHGRAVIYGLESILKRMARWPKNLRKTMKRKIIISALIGICGLASVSMGQLPSVPSYSMVIDPRPATDVEVFKARFPAADNRHLVIFEAVLPVFSEAACFASHDFSSAQPVGIDRASVAYDATTSSYNVAWANVRESRGSCRVLLVGGDADVDAADLTIWRSAFGSTQPLFDGDTNAPEATTSSARANVKQIGSNYTLSHQPPDRLGKIDGTRMNLRRDK